MKDIFDVAIVGTGPAGMFTAIELLRRRQSTSVVLFEKGEMRPLGDKGHETCGWGGAGAFSDGKLDLTHKVGGILVESGYLSVAEFTDLMGYVEEIYVSYCTNAETVVAVDDNPAVEHMRRLCEIHGMQLVPFPVRHLGTDRSYWIVKGIFDDLCSAGVDIRIQTEVTKIEPMDEGFRVSWERWEWQEDQETKKSKRVVVSTGDIISRKLVVCPGREGDSWFSSETRRLGLTVHKNRVDVGVRVEVPAVITNHLTDVLHEPKIIYHTPTLNDRVRTFCVCPNGFVVREPYHGLPVITVNGRGDSKEGQRTQSTNFALLVSQAFTSPFDDPVTYAVSIAQMANKLAGPNGVLIQRFGDVGKQRSTEERLRESEEYGFAHQTLKDATPGDLTLAIPHRHFVDIIEMLKALDWIAPGIAGPHTLLYGAEIKLYSWRVETVNGFETELPGLFVAGDGSGYTRGLMQSSIQGVVIARHIVQSLI